MEPGGRKSQMWRGARSHHSQKGTTGEKAWSTASPDASQQTHLASLQHTHALPCPPPPSLRLHFVNGHDCTPPPLRVAVCVRPRLLLRRSGGAWRRRAAATATDRCVRGWVRPRAAAPCAPHSRPPGSRMRQQQGHNRTPARLVSPRARRAPIRLRRAPRRHRAARPPARPPGCPPGPIAALLSPRAVPLSG